MDPFDVLDPRLAVELRVEYRRRAAGRLEPLPRGVTVVIAGHRAAGKTRLLPLVAQRLRRQAIDLDAEIERREGCSVRELFQAGEETFRRAERRAFAGLPRGVVVAVGGGFLSLHADLLRAAVVVVVPISFETYRERLMADATRPRLRPYLSLEAELHEVYAEREVCHRAARPMGLVEFLLRVDAGDRPRRVVTAPPAVDLDAFAWAARHGGADLLEVRTDLTPVNVDLREAARALPLLVSQRSSAIPSAWLELGELVDRPLGGAPASLVSFHADAPLRPAEAVELWREVPTGVFVKHIEPLGPPDQAKRLLETRAALAQRFGAERVTVLPMGPLATAFRAVLGPGNALDYLALDPSWAGAPGQRLLADAVREWRRGSTRSATDERLAILGHRIAHARSPRVHEQPFDRLDLPEDAPIAELLEALRPYYRGFAVTSPFKQAAASACGAGRRAVNTLVRTSHGYAGSNTDVDGAVATLEALAAERVVVLGDGGTTDALREAAQRLGVELTVHTRASTFDGPLSGAVVWTWPVAVQPPVALRFDGARVAVIAYGPGARVVKASVLRLGGKPLALGPRWFVAQARAQRAAWAGS